MCLGHIPVQKNLILILVVCVGSQCAIQSSSVWRELGPRHEARDLPRQHRLPHLEDGDCGLHHRPPAADDHPAGEEVLPHLLRRAGAIQDRERSGGAVVFKICSVACWEGGNKRTSSHSSLANLLC